MFQFEVTQITASTLSRLKEVWDLWPVWGPILIPSSIVGTWAWRNLKTEIKSNWTASREMFNLQERKQDARANFQW